MRAAISEPLQAYLRQQGRTVLTITLKPLRCCGGTLFEVLVDTREPKDPGRYASFVQDDLSIYYSPQLGRRSAALHWLLLTCDLPAYYNEHIRIYVYDILREKRKHPWNRSLQVVMLLPS